MHALILDTGLCQVQLLLSATLQLLARALAILAPLELSAGERCQALALLFVTHCKEYVCILHFQ